MMQKPTAASVDADIKTWLIEHWRHEQWGLMDCDRCRARTEDHPCFDCGRWESLIAEFRSNNPVKEATPMKVTPAEGQTIIPKWTVTADLHFGRNECVRMPLLCVDTITMGQAIEQVQSKNDVLRHLGFSLEVICVQKGATTEPLAEANEQIVARFMMPKIMDMIRS